MKTPSFRYMGGKSRLRKWLIERFPKSGGIYVEPFAGLGNVYYQAKKDLKFDGWHLSDLDATFFFALMDADLDELPERVNKTDFQFWKDAGTDISRIIEPKITFAGKGYKSGFDGGHESHPPYSGKLHRATCEEAKRLLHDATIHQKSWDAWDYAKFTPVDFLYFDPPYFNTKASYPNIDHGKLIEKINGLNCRWALSGYENSLYSKELNWVMRHERVRNSEIKGSNSGKFEAVNEVLWTNCK